MDDLTSSPTFDVRDYPPQVGAPVQMIQFVEYAFTFRPNQRGNFGLFVYLFNPGLWSIVTASPANRIQMASEYENDRPTLYEKFPLRFLSRSTGDVAGLFYKFQIVFTPEQQAQLFNRLSVHERRYDISGVELAIGHNLNATDFEIARTIRVSGFAQGHGMTANNPSTLTQHILAMRVINTEVHSTWYRTPTSARGIGWQHQINSVYFSVPNAIREEFQYLHSIHAEWWEYQTQPIFVTSRQSLYDHFRPIVGQHVNADNSLQYALHRNHSAVGGPLGPMGFHSNWIFNNVHASITRPNFTRNPHIENYMFYLFLVDSIEQFTGDRPVGYVSGEMLSNWIMTYDRSFRNGLLPVAGAREISADLFTDTIDQQRINNGYVRGHNKVEIEHGHTINLSFYEDVRLLDNFWRRHFGMTRIQLNNLVGRSINPIQPITSDIMNVSNETLSESLFINPRDIGDFRAFHAQASGRDETVYLFRFAMTDYYAEWLTIAGRNGGSIHNGQAYMAQQTVFLDFDIIQLTYRGQYGYYVIPVVSSPIDVIADITPPAHPPPFFRDNSIPLWLRVLFGLIVLLLVFGIVSRLLSIITPLLGLASATRSHPKPKLSKKSYRPRRRRR